MSYINPIKHSSHTIDADKKIWDLKGRPMSSSNVKTVKDTPAKHESLDLSDSIQATYLNCSKAI